MSVFTGWFRYWLERAVLGGSFALVVVLVAVQALVALLGAAIAYYLPGDHFESFGRALWWAVLRLSDPGYLSDDIPDISIRALSAALSVLGMAVTVGGIVAIVTQWMNLALRRLAAATTPVPFRGHFVIIGMSDRTMRIVFQLLAETNARIVLLLERVRPEDLKMLQRRIQKLSHLERVVLRAGSPYRPQELMRAACQGARAVIVPASPRAVAGDAAEGPLVLKCLLALRTLFEREDDEEAPTVVVEIVDRGLAPLVRATLPTVRLLPSDRIAARVLRLALQARDLVPIAHDVARPDRGLRVRTLQHDDFIGQDIADVALRIRGAKVMGLLQGKGKGRRLVVSGEARFQKGDQVLLLAGEQVTTEPKAATPPDEPVPTELSVRSVSPIKILVLGWNETAADLISDLSLEPAGRYEVHVLCQRTSEELEAEIEELVGDRCPVTLGYFQGDPLALDRNTAIDVEAYDRFVILADRSTSAELADVRSLALAVELDRLKTEFREGAYVLLELLEPENSEVISGLETIVTPLLAAHVLCSLALSEAAAETLSDTFLHQLSYVTRVVFVPANSLKDEYGLRRALLARGLAYLQPLSTSTFEADRDEVPLLVVEPTRSS